MALESWPISERFLRLRPKLNLAPFGGLFETMKYLYQLKFPNGKIYLGASVNPWNRFRAHMWRSRSDRTDPVYVAIREFGKPQLTVLVCGHDDYILDLEVKAIELYQTRNPANGYNVLVGGNLGRLGLPGLMLGKTISPEGRKRISDRLKGNSARKGIPQSEMTKQSISRAQTGRRLSEETKKRMVEAWKIRRAAQDA